MFNIVLVEPEIPPNTGNVIRLAANTGCALHLVEPLGFSMDDRLLRRAGLDYHEYADVRRHASWPAFVDAAARRPGRLFAFTHATAGAPSPTSRCAARRLARLRRARPPGLPAAVREAFDAAQTRAPADARRPAQPQPQQRRRRRGVRGLAPERLRRRRSERRALSRVSGSRALAPHQLLERLRRREPAGQHVDHGVDDRHLDAAARGARAAPSARCARLRRHGRARRGCAASGLARARAAGRPCGCATGRRWR